ncbi:SPOR domain-containing protein [Pseudoxanthomonas sp. SGNA-20]|uniref:SPOR domain-containing protein n=1 Tax=Pseudoxanthomonas sp. SGNA-20 TaxID=2493088 RepID=UPI000F639284|nr:SPOR domain-containing protein [Pseudoxanthomonas sp. SGNA-20]RRN56547.1 SPOR domain-containing protein [Pseudoxanthomonas sp. SGNA-20]
MDTTLKQRLIGAAVLVALAVIFLPMLVQGPAPDSGVADVSTRVPDAPASGYETRELPLLGAPAEVDAPAPAPEAEAAATDGEAAEAAPDPATAAGRWAVTFGAYASEKDAEAVINRLRQAGLEGFSERTTVGDRPAWRVRVGPFADRALAEAGRLRAVRIRNDVNAQVIALDAGAGEAAPAAAAATAPDTAAAAAPAATTASAATTATTPQPAAAQPAPARDAPRPAATTPAPAKTTATPAKSATASTSAATPSTSVPAPSPTPAASNVGFAVQMGAFSSQADANALRDRLRAAGFSAIVQPVRTDKGTLHRVRVGPVATRTEAEQLRGRLAAHGGGMVVPHP